MKSPTFKTISIQSITPFLASVKLEKWRKQLSLRIKQLTSAEILFHDGDLKVDRLEVGPQPLFINGHLKVKKGLEDGKKADETLLIVLGDVQAHYIATFSAIFISGNVVVKDVFYGDSSGDEVFYVGGNFTSKAVIEDSHHVEVFGYMNVEVLVGRQISAAQKPKKILAPHEALIRAAYKVEEKEDGAILDSTVNKVGLLKLLRAGRPLVGDIQQAPAEKSIAAFKDKKEGKKAKKLSLAGKKLIKIPDSVYEILDLETLILNDNKFDSIPPEIKKLKYLKKLELENLPIKALPEEIGALSQLSTLSLRYCNDLKCLPKSFAKLQSLEELFLDALAITEFPKVLAELPKLKKLWWWRVNDKDIGWIVKGLKQLPQLQSTGFLQSQITKLPKDLTPLSNLKLLKIGDLWKKDSLSLQEKKRIEVAMPNGKLHIGY